MLRAYASVVAWSYRPVLYITGSQLVVTVDNTIRKWGVHQIRRKYANWNIIERIRLGYQAEGYDFHKIRKMFSHTNFSKFD